MKVLRTEVRVNKKRIPAAFLLTLLLIPVYVVLMAISIPFAIVLVPYAVVYDLFVNIKDYLQEIVIVEAEE